MLFLLEVYDTATSSVDMFNFKVIILYLILNVMLSDVIGKAFILRESSPNGESVIAISSSDPNVEKYLTQKYQTRSGFKLDDSKSKGTVHRSFSIAVPGKAVAGNGRSFAAASTGSFQPFFPFPVFREYGFDDIYLKNWFNSVENFYYPGFVGKRGANTATAVNDNGHVYGKVGSVTFDNRAKT